MQSFLSDIAVDVDTGFAFITDAKSGSIIVYDSATDTSWQINHPSMRSDGSDHIQKFIKNDFININSIAITPFTAKREKFLLYDVIGSSQIFYINSADLRVRNPAPEAFKNLVTKVPGIIGGMIIDSQGRMYFSDLQQRSLYKMDIFDDDRNFPKSNIRSYKIIQDNSSLVWPDGFSIDNDGDFLWASTRSWPRRRERNFIVRLPIGRKSSQYYEP